MEKNVQIGNEWWTIMTIYSKEMKTTIIIGVEDATKKNREECMLFGGDFNGRIGERGARNWEEVREDGKENPKTKWKMQRGRD
jgi:hypothetical protein